MSEIVLTVKHVVVFLLGAALLIRLFGGTEYRKYMEYAAGLIVIAIFATPVLSLFGTGKSVEDWFDIGVLQQKSRQNEEEIRILGEKYEQSVWEKYEKEICQDVAKQCGTDVSKCRVKIDGGKITKITIKGSGQNGMPVAEIRQLAMRYGVDEDSIFFIEE